MQMKIRKSEFKNGWIGFFGEDEFGNPEESFSVKDIGEAQKIVTKLQKDIENLTKHNTQKTQSAEDILNKDYTQGQRLF